jgi:hypothetical protein
LSQTSIAGSLKTKTRLSKPAVNKSKINLKTNFRSPVKKIVSKKPTNYTQRFMKSISEFGNNKTSKTRRKGKNMTVDRKEDALKINYSTNPSHQKPREITVSEGHYKHNHEDSTLGVAKPIILTDSETGYQIRQYALTAHNSSKHFDFDIGRHSAGPNGPVLTHPEQRRMTQEALTDISVYKTDFAYDKKQLTRNNDSDNYNNTIKSLRVFKRATSGDTGSSNFVEVTKVLNDSDSETELVFVDLSGSKGEEPSSSKSNTNLYKIFKILNKPGVNSTAILKFLKAEVLKKSQLMQLLKLQDKDNDSYTILHYTAKLGFVSVMTYIMTHCQNIDLNVFTKQGKTPLHI